MRRTTAHSAERSYPPFVVDLAHSKNLKIYCACFSRPVGKPIASASPGITFRRSIK